jgi:outer membrane protein OmpA-like peptidoglycan-associated protein
MGRVWVLLVALLISVANVSAQQTLADDTFDSAGEWWTGETSDGNCEVTVEDGKLKITETDDSGFRYFGRSISLNSAKNWSISVRIRQVDGDDEDGFGIAFNTADVKNTYHFVIRTEGEARLDRRKENEYQDLDGWNKVSVNGQGEWNDVEVRKVNDALTGYVNGRPICTITASYFTVFGDRQGVVYHNAQEIEVDRFTVKQWDPEPVATVLGADPSVKPVSLGPSVNSSADESVDCIAPDGRTMYYSRRNHPQNMNSDTRDIWVTTKRDDGSWNAPQMLPEPVNNTRNNFAIAITQDLNTLFLQGRYTSSGMESGMSYTTRTRSGWSDPVNQDIDDFENLAEFYNSTISPDGKVMIMSVRTPSSLGGNDLYVSFLQSSGTWSALKNIGNVVNSQGTEMGPFIAGDGKTLFFASNGHPGYGGRDIYLTRRLDDSWLKWSKPENLGQGINSDEHETFFQVPARGDSAYYSSQKNSLGEDDILSVKLPIGARPNPVFLVRGRVLDSETKQPVEANVVYEDLGTNTTAGTARSAPSDGRYSVALVSGKQYGVRAEASGYYALSEQFDARSLQNYTEVERDLYLTPIKKNVAIRLNNVFFDFGKYDLRPESYPELDRLVDFLNKNAAIKIEVRGHTDNVGKDADNLTLSQNRVNSVKSYLEGRGVPAARIAAKGYGETAPIASNDTDEGRQENRRVEFVILD